MIKRFLSVLWILLSYQACFSQKEYQSTWEVFQYHHGLKMLNLGFLFIGVFTQHLRIVRRLEIMLDLPPSITRDLPCDHPSTHGIGMHGMNIPTVVTSANNPCNYAWVFKLEGVM